MTPALVVLGATGAIGRGVVDAALQAGSAVIAVARGCSGLKALEALHPNADLTLVRASVATDREGAKLAKTLRKLDRPIAGVVAAVCGGGEPGRVLDASANVLRRRFDEDVLPHLVAARHLLPLLTADHHGRYVLIGGPGSEHPWAGYGHRSVGAAALRMLACALHDEARPLGVRVQLLTVDTPARTDANAAHACPEWPDASDIGRQALALCLRRDGGASDPVVRYRPEARPTVLAPGSTFPRTEAPSPPLPVPDGDAACLSSRCLQDARALLESITHPAPKSIPSKGEPPR